MTEVRPFSEVRAERRAGDAAALRIEAARRDVAELEAEARDAIDPDERIRLQCEAEALRAAIDEASGRFAR